MNGLLWSLPVVGLLADEHFEGTCAGSATSAAAAAEAAAAAAAGVVGMPATALIHSLREKSTFYCSS